MEQPQQHFLDLATSPLAAAHRIAWLEWGDIHNPRVVFCVHGLTRNAHDFDYLANALQKHYRVVCPDMPGRGQSDWLQNPLQYGYPLYAADCLALLHHLGIAACNWVGTSMGGIIGMMVAGFQPHRIKRLVLNDVGAVVAAEGLKRISGYAGKKMVFSNREEAEIILRELFTSFGIHDEAHWRHVFTSSLQQGADGRWHMHYDPNIIVPLKKDLDEPKDIDLAGLWKMVHCPVLIIRGAESDLLRRETAQKMHNERPNVTLVEIEGAGHAPALMEDSQIDMIANWLHHTLSLQENIFRVAWWRIKGWILHKFAASS